MPLLLLLIYLCTPIPQKSFHIYGRQYLLVAYHYDANHLCAKVMRNIEAATIAEAYKKIKDYFAQAEVKHLT